LNRAEHCKPPHKLELGAEQFERAQHLLVSLPSSWQIKAGGLPESISHTGFYSIHNTFTLHPAENSQRTKDLGLVRRLHAIALENPRTPMPQEISVSYQAIKSKVYRLIDALVVGEKSEAEVQDSIRRWWSLIHPADRPIAQKYLLMVLGRSASALDAMGDELVSVSAAELSHPHMPEAALPSKRLRLIERVMKEAGVRQAV
jgi:hypothetical protein